MNFMENNKDKTEIDADKTKGNENEDKVNEKPEGQERTGKEDKSLENKYKQRETKQKVSIFLSRNFKWLLLGWLIIIFLVGFFFFILSKYQAIVSSSTIEREQKEEEYSQNKKYLEETKELITVYQKIDRADIEKFDLILPLKNIQEELFSKLKAIVVANGLILKSLSIENDESSDQIIIARPQIEVDDNSGEKLILPKEIGRIKIGLSVLGIDYFSLVNLLNSMERNLRLLDIINIEFAPDDNSLILGLYAYYLKE